MEVSCEYLKANDEQFRIWLRTKKFSVISEKTPFNNEIVKFSGVNIARGLINFYILINSRKIKSKDQTKNNFFSIVLKDVGTNVEKKYKSKIIVNGIKMDFSIHLIPKANNNVRNMPNNLNMSLKPRQIKMEKPKNEVNFDRKRTIDRRVVKKSNEASKSQLPPKNMPDTKQSTSKLPASKKPATKLPASKPPASKINESKLHPSKLQSSNAKESKIPPISRAIRAVTMANQIRCITGTSRTARAKKIIQPIHKTVSKSNIKEKKINEKKEKENEISSQKFPVRKKTAKTISKKEEKENKIRPNPKNYYSEKKVDQILTEEKKTQNKLNVIKAEEVFLDPIKYEQYLAENNPKNKQKKHRETFCEGFFISSFPQKDGQVIEKSQTFPAPCGHKECSALPAMKPEIILRYPLEDTKNLELNNLAATICFPTGIKVCYTENEPEMIKDYITPITNQKGERYYMMTFHFYFKMENDIYSKSYEMHPLKHHLMKFADAYLNMSEDEMNEKITEQIQKDLEQAQNLGFRDTVFIPYCICLISKYPYVTEMKKCLQSIYSIIINNVENLNSLSENSKINYLIMHLINSVPIPVIESKVHFYIPYFSKGIELKCPKLSDLKMNSTISELLKLFSIDYIVIIFRFLIFEKKVLFIDEDYTRLSSVTDNFISLLYPFQWIHTYIPIMSDQMLKYLETFLPFLNGIHLSLMPLVSELFKTGEMEEGEEMFLIYINKSKFRLGSTLIDKNIKKYKYVEENVPALPSNLEKELKNKLKKIKDEIDSFQKKNPNFNLSEFDLKIRNVFIEMFVKMFHDIDKYLCFLDEDVVFNKNLFMENVPKEDKKFYDEFIDTQLFQLFTQNIISDELNYFKSMINEYNKNNKFSDDKKEENKNPIKTIYIINPDYLGIKENDKKNIEIKIKDKYYLKDGKVNDKRITEYIQKIEKYNYNNKNCNIYVIPEKSEDKNKALDLLTDMIIKNNNKNIVLNQFKKRARAKAYKNEMNEKEKEEIKEKIKDFTIKIFKSEEIEEDAHSKKDLQNDINTNFGREFFVNLLSKNTSNVILLKVNSFNLLGTIIYNTLLYILKVEENNIALEQIVILIKSTMFFGKEEKETVGYFRTEEKKNTITLWNLYKPKIRGYSKVNQANLWNKWYDMNLNVEKEKGEESKKKVIVQVFDLMIELELDKNFIKNTIDKLIKRVFEKNDEMLQDFIEKIKKAKYNANIDKK